MFTKITDITTGVYTSLMDNETGADAILVCLTEAELRQDGVLGQPQLDQALERMRAKGLFTGASGELEALPTHGLLPYAYVLVAGLGPAASRDTLRAAAVLCSAQDARAAVRTLGAEAAKRVRQPVSRLGADRRAAPRYVPHRGVPQERACARGAAPGGVAHRSGCGCSASGRVRSQPQRRLRRARTMPGISRTSRAISLFRLPSQRKPFGIAQHYGFACEVLDEHEIAARGMGGLTRGWRGQRPPAAHDHPAV